MNAEPGGPSGESLSAQVAEAERRLKDGRRSAPARPQDRAEAEIKALEADLERQRADDRPRPRAAAARPRGGAAARARGQGEGDRRRRGAAGRDRSPGRCGREADRGGRAPRRRGRAARSPTSGRGRAKGPPPGCASSSTRSAERLSGDSRGRRVRRRRRRRRRGRPLDRAAGSRAGRPRLPGLPHAALPERQLLGPGRAGGGARTRRLARAPRRRHDRRRARPLPGRGGAASWSRRRRPRSANCRRAASSSTSTTKGGWRWASRAATRARRIVHSGGSQTGHEITSKLAAMVAVEERIEVLERTSATALWSDGERCHGVITDAGPMAAAATVLATGGAAALWQRTTNPRGAIGAGPVLGAAAGADLADLEFCQFHPTALALPGTRFDGALITEAIRGEGAEAARRRRRALHRRAGPARRGHRGDPRPDERRRAAHGRARPARHRPGPLPQRLRLARRGRAGPARRTGPGRPRRPLHDGRRRGRPRRPLLAAGPLRRRRVLLHRPARRQPPRLQLAQRVLRLRRPRRRRGGRARSAASARPSCREWRFEPPTEETRDGASGATPARCATPTTWPAWSPTPTRWHGRSRPPPWSGASRAAATCAPTAPIRTPELDGVHLVARRRRQPRVREELGLSRCCSGSTSAAPSPTRSSSTPATSTPPRSRPRPGTESDGVMSAIDAVLARAGAERRRGRGLRPRDDGRDQRPARGTRRPHGPDRHPRLRRPARDRPPGPSPPLPALRAEAGAAGRAASCASRRPSAPGPRACSSRSATEEPERLAAADRGERRRGGRDLPALLLPRPLPRAPDRRAPARSACPASTSPPRTRSCRASASTSAARPPRSTPTSARCSAATWAGWARRRPGRGCPNRW